MAPILWRKKIPHLRSYTVLEEAVSLKEMSVDKGVEFPESGIGCNIICVVLDIPVCTFGSLVRKWKLRHTIQALPKPVRASLKTLYRNKLKPGEETHTEDTSHSERAKSGWKEKTISRALHYQGLYNSLAGMNPLLKKSHVKWKCVGFFFSFGMMRPR